MNDSLADAIKVDELSLIYGRDYVIEEILGLKFKISLSHSFKLIPLVQKSCIP